MVKPAKPVTPVNPHMGSPLKDAFSEKEWAHIDQLMATSTVASHERLLWAMLATTEFRLGLGKSAFDLMAISTWIRGQLVKRGLNLDTLMLRAQQRVGRKLAAVKKKKAAADKALLKRAERTLKKKPKRP